jgi:hypothetical protein
VILLVCDYRRFSGFTPSPWTAFRSPHCCMCLLRGMFGFTEATVTYVSNTWSWLRFVPVVLCHRQQPFPTWYARHHYPHLQTKQPRLDVMMMIEHLRMVVRSAGSSTTSALQLRIQYETLRNECKQLELLAKEKLVRQTYSCGNLLPLDTIGLSHGFPRLTSGRKWPLGDLLLASFTNYHASTTHAGKRPAQCWTRC